MGLIKRGKSSLSLAFFTVLVLSIYFVIAAIANAPSGLTISRNVSTLYDEGNFSVNWTQDTSSGDGVANYTIFIYSNGILYNTTAKNDSNLGFTFNNHTEANYTFFIVALNLTNSQQNATSNISMYIDRTDPLINLTTATAPYTNGTSKNNTETLTLNISLTDGLSGLTGSACFVNINGTNQTIFVADGWCNTTNGNLTGLSDGNNTIKVYTNDTVGNLGLNDSFVIQIDTTAPSASAACSPSSVDVDEVVTCTCSGSDATSGVASSTASSTPDTSQTGTFSYGCTVIDNARNYASATASYVVGDSGGSTGSSSSSSTTFWTKGTIAISNEQVAQGHSANILAKQRVKMKVLAEDHYLGVRELTQTTAKIEISSTPQEKTLSLGEEWKVNLNEDNYYDLNVKLNSISDSKANVYIQSISELIPQEEPLPESTDQEEEQTITGEATSDESTSSNEKPSLLWLWILIGVIICVILFVVLSKRRRRKLFGF